jgi:hypothetical protein
MPSWRTTDPHLGIFKACVSNGLGPFTVALRVVDGEGADGVAIVLRKAVLGAKGAGPMNLGLVLVIKNTGELR